MTQAQRSRGQIIPKGIDNWMLRVFAGKDAAGKRQYHAKKFDGTFKQAQRELTKLLQQRDTGTAVEPTKLTVSEFVNQWLNDAVAPRVTSGTLASYRWVLDQYAIPSLGSRRLDQVTPLDVQRLVASMNSKGLSPRTIRYTITVLRHAFKDAVAWQILLRNPAADLRIPRATRVDAVVLTPEETVSMLEANRDRLLYPLWCLLLRSGLRIQEAAALTWADVDFRLGSVKVNKAMKKTGPASWEVGETKTPKSRRTVELSRPALVALRLQRARTAPIHSPLVFPSTTGTPLEPSNLRKSWRAALKRAKIEKNVPLKNTRHTHLTHFLAATGDLKAASSRAGHSTVQITGDVYASVLASASAANVDATEALLRRV